MNAVLHKEYVKAKNSVAVMMGMDPWKFSDTDFKVSSTVLVSPKSINSDSAT